MSRRCKFAPAKDRPWRKRKAKPLTKPYRRPGAKLRKRRRRLGPTPGPTPMSELRANFCDYTVEEMANIIGVSRSTLSSWERGLQFPRPDYLRAWAQEMKCWHNPELFGRFAKEAVILWCKQRDWRERAMQAKRRKRERSARAERRADRGAAPDGPDGDPEVER